MPVLSPRRSSSSALNGSYRNTFNTSNLDRPYYSSNSYTPRINSYSERFTTRTYIDSDGRRIFSRQGSITEDGITTRFKEELREPSVRHDSFSWDSCSPPVRENSVLDTPSRYERESSLTRSVSRDSRPALSSINVAESVAELHKKYSPANYVPACRRKNENISRSKSINDIGKPPLEKSERNSLKMKVNNGVNCNNGLSVCNNTNSSDKLCNNSLNEDDNGNRASVAEIRKKFDQKQSDDSNKFENGDVNGENDTGSKNYLNQLEDVEDEEIKRIGVKISENRFKKADNAENDGNKTKVGESRFKKADKVENDVNKVSGVKTGENRFKKFDNVENDVGNKEKSSKISENRFKKLDNIDTSRKPLKSKIDKNTPKSEKNENLIMNGNGKPSLKVAPNLESVEKTSLKVTGQKIIVKRKQENKDMNQENIDTKIDSSTAKCMPDSQGLENVSKTKFCEVSEVLNDGVELRGGKSEVDVIQDSEASVSTDESSRNSRTSNFASYIPSADFVKGDAEGSSAAVVGDSSKSERDDMEDRHVLSESSRYILHRENSDVSASPHLSRTISQNSGGLSSAALTSESSLSSDGFSQNSLDRHRRDLNDDRSYSRAAVVGSVKNAGLNGLKNIGNTCFMNSVLQCLSNTRLLLEYVRNDSYLNDINTTISGMKGALIKAFAQVIKELWCEDCSDRVVNTLSLKSQIQRFAPRFMGYSQQDAQEFLRYLLEGLHEDVNRVITKPKPIHTEIDEKLSDSEKSAESWRRYLRMDNSKIVDIFVGQLKSTLRCTHCGHCSVTFDPFWDLSLPIPQRAGPLRLQQCLDCFTREETLDGDEKPTCSKCKERRKCTKSFSIQKFPKILVIHLKRFSPTERYRGKLSLTIDFPIEGLDMQNYAAEGSNGDCRYNLYAISNHSGTTYSGHYTAYCRHPYAHTWHEYNDSRVSSISSKALVSGEAYVLFYELENQKSHL